MSVIAVMAVFILIDTLEMQPALFIALQAQFYLMHALIQPLHACTLAQLPAYMPGLFGRSPACAPE